LLEVRVPVSAQNVLGEVVELDYFLMEVLLWLPVVEMQEVMLEEDI